MATIVHIIGVFGITVTQNVPRNKRLEKTEDYWETFLKEQAFWNHVHTLSAILSTIFIIRYLL